MAWLPDTHALIWLTDDPGQLSDAVLACIDDAPDGVFVSVTSIWEIAIKRSIGKLDLPVNATGLLDIARKNTTASVCGCHSPPGPPHRGARRPTLGRCQHSAPHIFRSEQGPIGSRK